MSKELDPAACVMEPWSLRYLTTVATMESARRVNGGGAKAIQTFVSSNIAAISVSVQWSFYFRPGPAPSLPDAGSKIFT